jgi:NADPH:quinone reductase
MSAAIPEAMQAVVLEQVGGTATPGQVPVPRPGSGQVLVRMAASPINPSDLGFIRGSYGFQRPFPVVPGFEGSGVVVADPGEASADEHLS